MDMLQAFTNEQLKTEVPVINVGGMDGEGLLYTNTVGNTSYGKGLGNSAAVLSDNGTLEHLDSFAVAFFDFVVNTDCVSDVDDRGLCLKLLICKSLKQIHFSVLLKNPGIHAEHRSGLPFY